MFKSSKIVGATLVSGTVISASSLVANADSESGKELQVLSAISSGREICLPWINWAGTGVDIIPEDVEETVNDASWNFMAGYISKANYLREEAESLVKKYNLDIFLPWQDLAPYEALFDLSYCEDLDEQYCYLYEKKGVPEEVEKIINCETYYTNVIANFRKNLRKGGTEEKMDFTKRKLVVFFKERDLVRKKLASCVAKYGLDLEKKFIGAGKKEDANGTSKKEEKENKEQQSLVRTDAVSNESWGFLDIVFGIKDKVKSLLGLKKEEKEFVSKEEDFKREAKRQETEFSLSLLVKRFLDFVRGSDSIGVQDKNENIQKNSGSSANLLVSGQNNLLTDGSESNHQ